MNTAPIIRSSPNFDGTIGTTSTEPNPELGKVIKQSAAKALLKEVPSVSNLQVKLASDLEGVDPTSERSIYNHYGFVNVVATGTTCAGNKVELEGQYDTNQMKLMFTELKR